MCRINPLNCHLRDSFTMYEGVRFAFQIDQADFGPAAVFAANGAGQQGNSARLEGKLAGNKHRYRRHPRSYSATRGWPDPFTDTAVRMQTSVCLCRAYQCILFCENCSSRAAISFGAGARKPSPWPLHQACCRPTTVRHIVRPRPYAGWIVRAERPEEIVDPDSVAGRRFQ
jgi:hypothetical protein